MNHNIAIAQQQPDGSLIAVNCLWDRPDRPATLLPEKFQTPEALMQFINFCARTNPPRHYPDFCEFLEHGRSDFAATRLFIQADGLWYGTAEENPCGLRWLSEE